MAKRSEKQHSRRFILFRGIFALLVTTFCLVSIFIVYSYYSWKHKPLLKKGETRQVVIPSGADWTTATQIFYTEGLIEHPLFFRLWGVENHITRKLLSGTYLFTGPLSLNDLKQEITKGGRSSEVTIRIPEGFTIYHIADRLEKQGVTNRQAFLDAAQDIELLEEFAIPGATMEGYLFPSTYRFKRGVLAKDIVRKLYLRWQKEWEKIMKNNNESYMELSKKYRFSIHQFVTLASIIERETDLVSELPTIARVFYNRLDRDMKLQTDPTCVYGPKTYRERPSPENCKDPLNRYSTYIIKGLPPGPISNPGREALWAVLNPDNSAKARKYLYFVARPDRRGHNFSQSYRAHKRAVTILKESQ